MCKALEDMSAQDTEDRERSLITKLLMCKKEMFSISNYFKQFKGIYDELAAIQKPVSVTTKKVG